VKPCDKCNGLGTTMARRRLEDLVSALLQSSRDVQVGRGQPWPDFDTAPMYLSRGRVCGLDMLELTTGLAGRPPFIFGHGIIDHHVATKKIIAAAGLPETWGLCPECKGEGEIE
jgi:hypothetical protein